MSAFEHPFPAAQSLSRATMRRAALHAIQTTLWLGLICAGHASAQTVSTAPATSPIITDADMARVRRTQIAPTDQDIERARRQYSAPLSLSVPAAPTTPDIGALPQPLASRPIDLGTIAHAYASNPDGPAALPRSTTSPSLLVFISLTMPKATLQRLVEQAARAQASLILRGLVNGSLRDTVVQVQQLIGQHQASVQIDPQAFDRFSIARVPAFVLIRNGARPTSCSSGTCAPPQAFVRTAGDVSLDYALEHMVRVAPGLQHDARAFLQRLQRIEAPQLPARTMN